MAKILVRVPKVETEVGTNALTDPLTITFFIVLISNSIYLIFLEVDPSFFFSGCEKSKKMLVIQF